MINMDALTDADIGRAVIYTDRGNTKTEKGFITSFNLYFIFVDFGTNTHPACSPQDLDFEFIEKGSSDASKDRRGEETPKGT